MKAGSGEPAGLEQPDVAAKPVPERGQRPEPALLPGQGLLLLPALQALLLPVLVPRLALLPPAERLQPAAGPVQVA